MSGEDGHRGVLGKLWRDTNFEKLYFLPPHAEGGVNLLQKGTQLLQQAFPGLCTGRVNGHWNSDKACVGVLM